MIRAKLQNFWRHPLTRVLLPLIILSLILLLVETFPRYISLPIYPHEYLENKNSAWIIITRSVRTIYRGPIWGREFIVRSESNVLDEKATRNSTQDYYDQEMLALGWTRDNSYAPCHLYLPEANFLSESNGEITHYRKSNRMFLSDYNDLVCLAVWNEEEHYEVVLLTVNPSFLSNFWDLLSE